MENQAQAEANRFSQPTPTASITAQVTFRDGKKGAFIGSHDKKIVLAGKEHKDVQEGVAYDCVLKPMLKGNGYIVGSMTKAPTITAHLYFKDGNKDLMVSSYNERIVLMPERIEDRLQVQTNVEYKCEIVLAKSGKAYLVQAASELPPATAKVIYQGYPVFVVDVEINGKIDTDLGFDCIGSDHQEKVMQDKLHYLKKRNLLERENIAKEYEVACKKAIGEYNAHRYSRNTQRIGG